MSRRGSWRGAPLDSVAPMVLTVDEVAHFEAFGWVVLRLLTPAETEELTEAYMAAAVHCDDALLSGGGPATGGSRDRQRAENFVRPPRCPHRSRPRHRC